MLLGLSSSAIDESVQLDAVTGAAPGGVADEDVLSEFAVAAWRRDATLVDARAALRSRVGEAGLVEAAQTVAIFRSLNIAADCSGIPLDEAWAPHAATFVGALGLDGWPTAANTPAFRTVQP